MFYIYLSLSSQPQITLKNHTIMKKLITMIALATVFCGCSSDDNDGGIKPRKDIPLTETERTLTDGNVAFAFDLLKAAEKQSNAKQIILSPFSASQALSMLLNGAEGSTADEIRSVLGYSDADIEAINEYNNKMAAWLAKLDNTATVSTANSFWANSATEFATYSSYQKAIEKYYDAEYKNIDFGKTGSADVINNWCDEKTNGLIPQIIEELNGNSSYILANALYFSAKWKNSFSKEESTREKFTNSDGYQQTVTYMNESERKTAFTQNERMAVAELTYGNEAFGMSFILPAKDISIEECIENIDAEEWTAICNDMEERSLIIKLPKFSVKSNDNLTDIFKAMGMSMAFDEHADFSNMAENAAQISGILQGNHISIDEESTDAASVTVNDGYTYYPEDDEIPIDFKITRPFLFLVRERSTGTILFIGKIAKI